MAHDPTYTGSGVTAMVRVGRTWSTVCEEIRASGVSRPVTTPATVT